jgi:hypothetical protein
MRIENIISKHTNIYTHTYTYTHTHTHTLFHTHTHTHTPVAGAAAWAPNEKPWGAALAASVVPLKQKLKNGNIM